MDLSIIIVNWNVRDLLAKCLASIFREQKNLSLEVFVVDNASTDGSVAMVKKEFPQVNLIANQINQGFARANNQAIQRAQGESSIGVEDKFILLLNPDTEIIDNALVKMVEFMRQQKDCGLAGCQILNPNRTSQPSVRRFPCLGASILILLKLSHLLLGLRPLKKYLVLDFDYSQTQPVEQVMGAFFLIRRAVIEKIGLLDENYFIWFEEVDYCRRLLKQTDWKIYYTPAAQIIHYGGQSFQQVLSLAKQKMFNRSLLYYYQKHQPRWRWVVLWLLQPVSLLLAYLAQKRNRWP